MKSATPSIGGKSSLVCLFLGCVRFVLWPVPWETFTLFGETLHSAQRSIGWGSGWNKRNIRAAWGGLIICVLLLRHADKRVCDQAVSWSTFITISVNISAFIGHPATPWTGNGREKARPFFIKREKERKEKVRPFPGLNQDARGFN